MSQYKLTYFDAKGVAELSRLVLKVGGKKFEDIRVKEEWPKMKKDMPLEALPVLEVDGVQISQSAAIARFLAKECGLMGSTNMDELRINEIQEAMSELYSKHVFKFFGEKDEDAKKQMVDKFFAEELQKYLNFFKKRLAENKGSDFYIGKTITLADLIVYRGLEMLEDVCKKVDASKLSNLKDTELDSFCKKVADDKRIAAWVKQRPVTDF